MTGIKYRSDIQGLRAIAVLAVIVFHLNPAWLPGGFVGVDIFLVISGFLISTILLNKKIKPDYKLSSTLNYFYVSRFKRIAPAYFTTLIVVTLFSAVLFLPADFSIYSDGLSKAAWFNSNNYFAHFGDYFAPANHEQPLLHTWSLAVEVQFYIIAPFIFLLLPTRLLSWILPVCIIGFTFYAEYQLRQTSSEQATYYSLMARLPAFLFGAWIALFIGKENNFENTENYKRYLTWLAIALITFALFLPKITGYFPGVAGLVPVLGTVLLILLRANSSLSKILSSPTMVWIGGLSYSLYLWHWPVLAIMRYYTGVEILNWQYSVVFIVLTLSLSVASYYLIEVPLRLKRNKKQILGYSILTFFVLLMAVGMKKLNAYFTSEPLPVEYTRYADPNTICHGKIVGDCLKGDLTSDKEVLVLGDSHAAMLNHFFDYLGKELNFKARIITASSCLTIEGFDISFIAEWAHDDCASQIRAAKKYIEETERVILAGMWSYQFESQNNIHAVANFLELYNSKHLAVLPQIPELLISPLRYRRFQNIGLNGEQGFSANWKLFDEVIYDIAAECTSCNILKTKPFTSLGVLPHDHKQNLLYFDQSHLNEFGSKYYAKLMKPALSSWLGQVE
ncbi:MAG: acyltransferase [Bermanella sp.]